MIGSLTRLNAIVCRLVAALHRAFVTSDTKPSGCSNTLFDYVSTLGG